MGKYKDLVRSIIDENIDNLKKSGKMMAFKKDDDDADSKAELTKHKSHKDKQDDDPDNDETEDDSQDNKALIKDLFGEAGLIDEEEEEEIEEELNTAEIASSELTTEPPQTAERCDESSTIRYASCMNQEDGTQKLTIANVANDDIEGLCYIYYDTTQTLVCSKIPWHFGEGITFVSMLYWDADNKLSIGPGDERHGIVMDCATHDWMHDLYGAQWKEGFTPDITIGLDTLNSISAGEFYDEDIEHKGAIMTSYPYAYKDGPSYWRIAQNNDAIVNTELTYPYYNEFVGGVWTASK